jgi:hypothetical protein
MKDVCISRVRVGMSFVIVVVDCGISVGENVREVIRV